MSKGKSESKGWWHLDASSRRTFLRSLAFGGAVVVAGLLGFIPVVRRWKERLRPPGALLEKDFLASCIKCGQCVQVCPVEAIKLGDIDEGFGVGVPYIEAREQACDFSCDALQCILACPTGALSPKVNEKEAVDVGLARLARPDACLAVKGEGFKGVTRGPDFKGVLRYEEIDRWKALPISEHPYDVELCDLCVRECPIEGAIHICEVSTLDGRTTKRPVVHDECVGCGVCEMVCPVEPTCIVVDSRHSLTV